MNNQNDPVGSQWNSGWFSIPDNDTWYVIQMRDNPSNFPSATRKWNFIFEVSLEHAVDVDLHHQWYHNGW